VSGKLGNHIFNIFGFGSVLPPEAKALNLKPLKKTLLPKAGKVLQMPNTMISLLLNDLIVACFKRVGQPLVAAFVGISKCK